jgi:integrase
MTPGIMDFHFHDLRHTFDTRLGDCGTSQNAIGELLGHATMQPCAQRLSARVKSVSHSVIISRTADAGGCELLNLLEPAIGVEPMTLRLRIARSTN